MAHEIDTTPNLFRPAVEVYLRRGGERDFSQFRLWYDDGTGLILISEWPCANVTEPTRSQLIGLLTGAKVSLQRKNVRQQRREKNKRRVDTPPDVYEQQGVSHTGTDSAWILVPLQGRGETRQTPILIESDGYYRISMAGFCISAAGTSGMLRILDDNAQMRIRLQANHGKGTFNHFVYLDASASDRFIVQHEGPTTVTVTVVVELIILS